MYESILTAIRQGNITNADIAKATGIPLEKTGMLLRQMRDDGLVVSLTRGKWMERVAKWPA
jgi:predicted transcriptional regulator